MFVRSVFTVMITCICCGVFAFAEMFVIEPAAKVYSIVAGGDVMLGRKIAENTDKFGRGDVVYPWQHIQSIFREADISFVNLEGVASNQGAPLHKRYLFRFSPASLAGLAVSGVDIVSLANNHSLDYGETALCDTYHSLLTLGMSPVGAGCNRGQAVSPAIRVLPDGTRVAFLAMTEFYRHNIATRKRPGLAPFSIRSTIQMVEKLKNSGQADIVIVSVHAGIEHLSTPDSQTVEWYQELIEGGVDVVLGHHPHVPQPIVKYHQGYIVYSLGNLIFDMHDKLPHTKQQMLARILVRGGQVTDVEKIPIEMNDQFQPYLVVEEEI